MSMDIRDLKIGDVCKYIANGVERYMIIEESYLDKKTDINTVYTLWSIMKGVKIEDISNFTDYGKREMVDYTNLDYIRFNGNIYFPADNTLLITMDAVKSVVDYKTMIGDIEVIGHLSNIQLVFLYMYKIFSREKDYIHGRICDIETIDLSEIKDDLNKYIESYKIKYQWKIDKDNKVPDPDHKNFDRATDAEATMRNFRKSIPEWIEEHEEHGDKFSYGIPNPTPTKEIYDPDEDYDVKDIRDFEVGAIYQYLDYPIEKGGEIRYTFIKSNPTKNLSDEELETLYRNDENIIIFACDAHLYHEEGLFRERLMFNMHQIDRFSTKDYGYFRIDDRFYVANGGIANWVCRDPEGVKEMLQAKRFKLVTKIDPVQMKVASIASEYDLNGKIIELDKIDVDLLKPDVEEIRNLEDKIATTKLAIAKHQCNVMNALFGNTYTEEKDNSPKDVDVKLKTIDKSGN